MKVLKEAEAAELVVEQDPIGSILQQRATAGKHWQDRARTLMTNLKVLTSHDSVFMITLFSILFTVIEISIVLTMTPNDTIKCEN